MKEGVNKKREKRRNWSGGKRFKRISVNCFKIVAVKDYVYNFRRILAAI
jgi:hypothetical protein